MTTETITQREVGYIVTMTPHLTPTGTIPVSRWCAKVFAADELRHEREFTSKCDAVQWARILCALIVEVHPNRYVLNGQKGFIA